MVTVWFKLEHVHQAQAHLVSEPEGRQVGHTVHVQQLLAVHLVEVAVKGFEAWEVLVHERAQGAPPQEKVILALLQSPHNDEHAPCSCRCSNQILSVTLLMNFEDESSGMTASLPSSRKPHCLWE